MFVLYLWLWVTSFHAVLGVACLRRKLPSNHFAGVALVLLILGMSCSGPLWSHVSSEVPTGLLSDTISAQPGSGKITCLARVGDSVCYDAVWSMLLMALAILSGNVCSGFPIRLPDRDLNWGQVGLCGAAIVLSGIRGFRVISSEWTASSFSYSCGFQAGRALTVRLASRSGVIGIGGRSAGPVRLPASP